MAWVAIFALSCKRERERARERDRERERERVCELCVCVCAVCVVCVHGSWVVFFFLCERVYYFLGMWVDHSENNTHNTHTHTHTHAYIHPYISHMSLSHFKRCCK